MRQIKEIDSINSICLLPHTNTGQLIKKKYDFLFGATWLILSANLNCREKPGASD